MEQLGKGRKTRAGNWAYVVNGDTIYMSGKRMNARVVKQRLDRYHHRNADVAMEHPSYARFCFGEESELGSVFNIKEKLRQNHFPKL